MVCKALRREEGQAGSELTQWRNVLLIPSSNRINKNIIGCDKNRPSTSTIGLIHEV